MKLHKIYSVVFIFWAYYSYAQNPYFFSFEEQEIFIVEKKQIVEEENSKREEKNRIHLVAKKILNDGYLLEGNFITYYRLIPDEVTFKKVPFKKVEDSFSRFILKKNGEYIVDKEFLYPNYQSLPTFTIEKFIPQWQAPAKEIFRFQFLNEIIEVPFLVSYQYVGQEEINYLGSKTTSDKFLFNYKFQKKVNLPQLSIQEIQGESRGTFWFSRKLGIPLKDEQEILYNYGFKNQARISEKFHIQSLYRKLKKIDKKEIIHHFQEIQNQNLNVKETDKGVTIEMNQILFDFNSFVLRENTKKILDEIYNILKQYPEREIQISGHTDNIGSDEYNLNLSEKRAEEVAKYLIQKGLNEDQISFSGYGSSQPVAPNDTPENRAKNRRVEILIVTE